RDGWVDLRLAGLPDGEYRLAIDGHETGGQAGPDSPIKTSNQFKDRLWLKQSFPVDIAQGAIVRVDHELVPTPAFRLLIDPVWMKSVRATTQQGRVVTHIVIHRTDSGGLEADNAANEASTWATVVGARTGAHYILARDGTLIKCVDESQSIGHA